MKPPCVLQTMALAALTLSGCAAPQQHNIVLDPMTVKPSVAMVKLDPQAKEIKIPGRIEFRTGKAELRKSSHALLDQVVAILKANPQIVKLEIQGHTDDVGDTERNQGLSQQRAEAVQAYLVQQGIAGGTLEPKGYGEQRPIADNGTSAGRASNRRVEFHIVGDKAAPSEG